MFLAGLPRAVTDPLLVMLFGASPILEVRGSIPFGVAVLKMPVVEATIWSIIGNTAAIFLIYGLGNWWLRLVERRKGFWQRLTDRVLHRTRLKFNGQYLKYGLVALCLFVAIPLPMTGAWTGSLAGFIFGIPLRKAFWPIFLGIVIAALIVAAITSGAVVGFSWATKSF
ncbi:MAG: small multi-drug export protein [Patescibacteria group bacterium]|jgi:uncharacterized membrane protein